MPCGGHQEERQNPPYDEELLAVSHHDFRSMADYNAKMEIFHQWPDGKRWECHNEDCASACSVLHHIYDFCGH